MKEQQQKDQDDFIKQSAQSTNAESVREVGQRSHEVNYEEYQARHKSQLWSHIFWLPPLYTPLKKHTYHDGASWCNSSNL